MPTTCSVFSCYNNRGKVKQQGTNTVFHKFPKDTALRNEWKKFCNRGENWEPNKFSVICSLHFQREDYQLHHAPFFKNKNMRRLNFTAVPSIVCLAEVKTETEEAIKEELLIEERRRKLYNSCEYYCETCEEKDKKIKQLEIKISTQCVTSKELVRFKQSHDAVKQHMALAVEENKALKKQIACLQRELKMVKNRSIQPEEIMPRMKKMLANSLTSNQIDLILQEKQRVRWTKEEICNAFTLRHLGKSAYKFIAQELRYPLPSLSTLEKYAQKIEMKRGILEDFLNLIRSVTQNFSPKDRECVISFNEMRVASVVEYDPAADDVMGPHNTMQVVMARGLFRNWKQPIYVGFDTTMTSDVVVELIKKLDEVNINVVAIVSDSSPASRSCWNELGAGNYNRPFFPHPVTSRNIYVFPDVLQLLKLMRNSLIDHGLTYKETKITVEPLHNILQSPMAAEMKPALKINKGHLKMTSSYRQNIDRAAQLFSRAVAIPLRKYDLTEEAHALAHFLEIGDLWFSVSNSHMPSAKDDYKQSYHGKELQKQALHDMRDLMLHSIVIGEHSLQPYQKAVLTQTTALQLLFDDMKEKHEDAVKFISTYKLNLDELEKFFSQVRQKGDTKLPSPLSCMYGLKVIILGNASNELHNQIDAVQKKTQEQEEWLNKSNPNETNVNEPHEEFIAAELNYADITPSSEDMVTVEIVDESHSTGNGDPLSILNSIPIARIEQEQDGLPYIMGHLAKMFQHKFPKLNLASQTSTTANELDFGPPPTFLDHLSPGELYKPSEQFMAVGKKMEEIFQQLHINGHFQENGGIVQRLAAHIHKHIELPAVIVNSFAKQRVIARMRFLNMKSSSVTYGAADRKRKTLQNDPEVIQMKRKQ